MIDEKEINKSLIGMPKEKIVEIYNLLHSIEVKGDAVDVVAYIKQILKTEMLKSES